MGNRDTNEIICIYILFHVRGIDCGMMHIHTTKVVTTVGVPQQPFWWKPWGKKQRRFWSRNHKYFKYIQYVKKRYCRDSLSWCNVSFCLLSSVLLVFYIGFQVPKQNDVLTGRIQLYLRLPNYDELIMVPTIPSKSWSLVGTTTTTTTTPSVQSKSIHPYTMDTRLLPPIGTIIICGWYHICHDIW
jgi:hypothetical protein